MAAAPDEYLAVVKAAYDYDPQSEDEVAIKENQLLFLLEKTDDDWWKIKVKTNSQDDDGPIGLVPAAYVEPADHLSTAKALYDYAAIAPGELSIKEEETLLVFDKEDEWLLVQSEGGRAGFVPANYVEETAADDSSAPSTAPQIVIPDSPPRPAYTDPSELVRKVHPGNADKIQTWAVSDVDKKGKKKKGTLGVGNGSVFFASESDKTPVQKWQTADIDSVKIDKSKHVIIEVGGASPISLHFSASSKDIAEEILAKLESSKAASAPPSAPSPAAVDDNAEDEEQHDHREKKNGASVHFAPTQQYIPPREPSTDDDEAASINSHALILQGHGESATAMYDFVADGEDELSVHEGEQLIVLEKDGDDWWKCRNSQGGEGVVPASYVELAAGAGSDAKPAPAAREDSDDEDAAREAEERAESERLEREREAEARAERARAEKERAERDRKRKEAAERAQAEAEAEKKKEREKKRSATAEAEAAARRKADEDERHADEEKKKKSAAPAKRGPPPERTRVWHDKSGQFRVEAALIGFKDGKLKLHKANGVVIEVPSQKMSPEDMKYVETLMNKKSSSSSSSSSTARPPRPSDDDDVPLAVRRQSLPPQKKAPVTDWFDFFLSAGCDVDDCSRYAQSFERDKIDEAILPDITEGTMRSLGLREGDIIRVKKAIELKHPVKKDNKHAEALEEQIRKDEELARQLQNEGSSSKNRTTSPAPNLFAGPNGELKNNTQRRGRPQPSKSLPPSNVDLIALNSASEQAQRSTTPLVASPTGTASSTPVPVSAASTGFDDDAWTNRPSSTKPLAPTPPAVAPRAPSAPPAPPPPPAAPPVQTMPSISEPISGSSGASSQSTGGSLAKATESDVFNQLARLTALRSQVPPRSSSVPVPPPTLSPPIGAGYQQGMGVGLSSSPLGQHLQAQQTGMFGGQSPLANPNGPRGPYAPVPANQGLLAPLVPTTTGFNSFVPTRPVSAAAQFQPQSQPSFLQSQPTGYPGPQSLLTQPTGFLPTQQTGFAPPQQTGFAPLQPNGFGQSGSLMSQPTGFQSGSLMAQPTGLPNGGFGGQGLLMSQPTGFGGVQTNPTGFNSGFGQYNGGVSSPPPVPPLPASAQKDVTPANIFAQMKSGTFASDSQPQPASNYDALRPNLAPQPTGWGYAANGFQGGYNGYQR